MLHSLIENIDSEENVADNLVKVMEIGNNIEGLDENLVRPDRKYVHEGAVKIFPQNSKKSIADYVYLFNDMLIFCQTSGKNHSYVSRFYIHRLQIQEQGNKILLLVDNNKFEFVVNEDNHRRDWILFFTKSIHDVTRNRKVFGVPLNILRKRDVDADVPSIVEKSTHFIYEYGLDKEGIFRQAGRSTQIENLKDQLNQGANVFFSENMDVHSVANLLKLWLRELPEPLLTFKAYSTFMKIVNISTKENQISAIRDALSDLPKINQRVTYHLLKCLASVCENEKKTKMNPGNLAVVFAPNILKDPDPNANPFDPVYYSNINTIFVLMLENFDTIFPSMESTSKEKEKEKKKKRRSSETPANRERTLKRSASVGLLRNSSTNLEGQVFMLSKKKWNTRLVSITTDTVIVKKNSKVSFYKTFF